MGISWSGTNNNRSRHGAYYRHHPPPPPRPTYYYSSEPLSLPPPQLPHQSYFPATSTSAPLTSTYPPPPPHPVHSYYNSLLIFLFCFFLFAGYASHKERSDGCRPPVCPDDVNPYCGSPVAAHPSCSPGIRQPSGTGIDLGFFELDGLSKPSAGEDVFPLVIVAESWLPSDSIDGGVDESVANTFGHMQITQAVLDKKDGEPFQVRVIRQILWVDGVRYELHEIYGIGNLPAEGFSDSDPGKECVICMTEPKDIAVLPCRHMCMCGDCAKALRLQSNKCPICRQPIEELIEIKINGPSR
ncbi:hypothetical protein K2173_017603 [Erythroxylum novogranatense]|uniref:RING-type E3 ubiquitin transferase n=1 Tax=Erythroxylum novogranatense TaxID=1862640 RepID=A0AAV8TNQ4_9ROSI|nr:hypothetical protein K2173_017603 [Erythroxylum novogranatense]